MDEKKIMDLICGAPDINSQGWANEQTQGEVSEYQKYMTNVVKKLNEEKITPESISDDWLRRKVERIMKRFG